MLHTAAGVTDHSGDRALSENSLDGLTVCVSHTTLPYQTQNFLKYRTFPDQYVFDLCYPHYHTRTTLLIDPLMHNTCDSNRDEHLVDRQIPLCIQHCLSIENQKAYILK